VLYNTSGPPVLRIKNIQRHSDGQVVLTLSSMGPTGWCVIERAETLGAWQEVGVTSGPTWTDTDTISEQGRDVDVAIGDRRE